MTKTEAKAKLETIFPYLSIAVWGSSAEVSDIQNFTFKQMHAIAEAFGTEKLDFSTSHSSGCESCDYGAQTDLYIRFVELEFTDV